MGIKEPTPVSFWRAVYLCAVAIFRPTRFDQLERSNIDELNRRDDKTQSLRIDAVRIGLYQSFVAVLVSAAFGVALGYGACRAIGRFDGIITILQIIGAALLLWGTLFVRGWDIGTYSAATLTERVNQWLYRGLYCVGTTLLVMSVVWTYVC